MLLCSLVMYVCVCAIAETPLPGGLETLGSKSVTLILAYLQIFNRPGVAGAVLQSASFSSSSNLSRIFFILCKLAYCV